MPESSSAALSLAPEAIQTVVSRLITDWLFPGECYHTPSVDDQIRAEKYSYMLQARMTELANQGINPLEMSAKELLPHVRPYEIPLTESDY